MTILAGLDIGGTKCAVSLGKLVEDQVQIIEKVKFSTPNTPQTAINDMKTTLDKLIEKNNVQVNAIGISCGGPLNSRKGVILSPPNLPGWDHIEIVSFFESAYTIPVALQNDANAGALAEWNWGAGKGCENMIFLTFGTGMGAGLILNSQLYAGTNDLAGEVGHIRLAENGPVGFGKAGSFEGFCSGGGIAKLAMSMAETAITEGTPPAFCSSIEELPSLTTQLVGEAAQEGDVLALEVFSIVGKRLGRGVSTLIDILNPEKVVIGSIYGRQLEILESIVHEELKKETIDLSLTVCDILPASLGEKIGDYASLSVALYAMENVESI